MIARIVSYTCVHLLIVLCRVTLRLVSMALWSKRDPRPDYAATRIFFVSLDGVDCERLVIGDSHFQKALHGCERGSHLYY